MPWILVKDFQNEMGEIVISSNASDDGHVPLRQFVEVLLETTRVLRWSWDFRTQEWSTQTLRDFTFTNREMYMKYRVFLIKEFEELLYSPVDKREFDDLHGILNSATSQLFQLKQIADNRFNCVLWQDCVVSEWLKWTEAIVERFKANGYVVVVKYNELYTSERKNRLASYTDEVIVGYSLHPHGVLTLEITQ